MLDTFYVAEMPDGTYISGWATLPKPPRPTYNSDINEAVWSWNEHDLQAWLDNRNITVPISPTQKLGVHPTAKPPVT